MPTARTRFQQTFAARMLSLRSSIVLVASVMGTVAGAQCGPVINTFPYEEGFENAAAWTSGGSNNDWAWGTPAHPSINTAGGGVKSWCVGGLTGQFYEFDAQSWIMSPCFDFSTLAYPWVSFKIYWETERTYDGITFQYSLDQGNTWDNVGAFGDPADCWNINWFNTANITNLDEASPKHGWSGREGNTQGSCQGGQGSEGWVTAAHCMTDLAGEPSVRFRFLFGSGTTCNDYDGVAIDDVFIGEPPFQYPALSAVFDCTGNTVTVSATLSCQTDVTWNFGDPGSGAANTAVGMVATHTFSAGPGEYLVMGSVSPSCGGTWSSGSFVHVLDLATTSTPATCGQENGSVGVDVSNGLGVLDYVWEPGGYTTPDVSDLPAGDYTVTISGANTNNCVTTATVTVPGDVNDLVLEMSHTDVSCFGAADGTAAVAVSGGAVATIEWSPAVSDQLAITALPPGTQTVTIINTSGCEFTGSVEILEPEEIITTINDAPALCDGQGVTLEPVSTGGSGTYSYTWSPEGPQVAPSVTTTYSVVATDGNGCTSNAASVVVSVGSTPQPTLSVDEPVGCSPHCVTFTPGPAGIVGFVLQHGDGSAGDDAVHCYLEGGTYDVSLTVVDAAGCQGTATFNAAIRVEQSPVAGFGTPAVVVISDGPVLVSDASFGAEQWDWDFGGAVGDDTLANPTISFPAVGCYTLQQVVTNTADCSDTAVAVICVEDEFAVYAPNAFTPNADGLNEGFRPVLSVREPSFYELLIFDRWGRTVFTTDDHTDAWTAPGIPDGVYAWRMTVRDAVEKLHTLTGSVIVLR